MVEEWMTLKCVRDGSVTVGDQHAWIQPKDSATLSPRRQCGPLEVGEAFLDFHSVFIT